MTDRDGQLSHFLGLIGVHTMGRANVMAAGIWKMVMVLRLQHLPARNSTAAVATMTIHPEGNMVMRINIKPSRKGGNMPPRAFCIVVRLEPSKYWIH